MRRIYLDNLSTTPVDPRVLESMLPYFTEQFGNAASRSHDFGWEANNAVEAARVSVKNAIGAASVHEIIFTSGGTESNNLALKGSLEACTGERKHVVISAIEHKSVLDCAKRLAANGYEVTRLSVNGLGRVEPERLRAAITDKTALVSVMLANNEVGTVQPIAELASVVHERGALFHVDAVQGFGKVDFDVERMHVDLASLSAHKVYGPKGCGALYVRHKRPRVRIMPQMDGGGHEQGLRSGTLNVPAIVGFGCACELLVAQSTSEHVRIAQLRDELQARLLASLPQVSVNGDPVERLPGCLNMSFHYVESEGLMRAVKEVALSSGSACSSATPEPSYVLAAMGLHPSLARCSVRFGIGRFNTKEELDYVATRVIDAVHNMRNQSPLWQKEVRPSLFPPRRGGT
jgi:cysteine desulfurase